MTKHEERIELMIDSVSEFQDPNTKLTKGGCKLIISGLINAEIDEKVKEELLKYDNHLFGTGEEMQPRLKVYLKL